MADVATSLLQTDVPNAPTGLLATAKRLERLQGRPAAEMLLEAVKLSYGPSKLRPNEYFELGLFDAAYSAEERARFIGLKRGAAINKALNGVFEWGPFTLDNKIWLAALLKGAGLGGVETQAMILGDHVSHPPTLPDRAATAAFLRETARYPLFGKPFRGSLSIGAASLDAYLPERDILKHHSGEETSVDAFVDAVFGGFARSGYLFQTRLAPHPALEPIAGPAVGCLRILTLHRGDHIEVAYAVWKAPALRATADNFWRPGNMIVDVDVDTGVARRCQRASGAQAETLQNHPGTGAAIAGATLPIWSDACETARRAAELFPLTPIIGWDMALTPDGPVIIEANTNPHHTLHQMAARRGFLTPALEAYVVETRARLLERKQGGARASGPGRRHKLNYLKGLVWGQAD